MSTPAEMLATWLNGTPTGGPDGDGKYPLIYKDGTTYFILCPAAQALTSDDEVPLDVRVSAAQAAATAAAGSATGAGTSAANAATSAAGAAGSASAAAGSATAAGTSATLAAASAAAAALSVTAAAGSVTSAGTAATAASTSATAAAGSATTAGTNATAAATSATNAATSASAAATSATAAAAVMAPHNAVALTPVGSTVTLDCSLGEFFTLALSVNATLVLTNPPLSGCVVLKVSPSPGGVLTLPGSVTMLNGATFVSGVSAYVLGLMTNNNGASFDAVQSTA